MFWHSRKTVSFANCDFAGMARLPKPTVCRAFLRWPRIHVIPNHYFAVDSERHRLGFAGLMERRRGSRAKADT
jgi:hypothetical protein